MRHLITQDCVRKKQPYHHQVRKLGDAVRKTHLAMYSNHLKIWTARYGQVSLPNAKTSPTMTCLQSPVLKLFSFCLLRARRDLYCRNRLDLRPCPRRNNLERLERQQNWSVGQGIISFLRGFTALLVGLGAWQVGLWIPSDLGEVMSPTY